MITRNVVYDTLRYFVLINPVNLDSADLNVSLERWRVYSSIVFKR